LPRISLKQKLQKARCPGQTAVDYNLAKYIITSQQRLLGIHKFFGNEFVARNRGGLLWCDGRVGAIARDQDLHIRFVVMGSPKPSEQNRGQKNTAERENEQPPAPESNPKPVPKRT